MTLYNNLPSLDLHGEDREYARIVINDFIRDHYQIQSEKIIIIHGIGTGILRKTTQDTLRKNKLVKSYRIDFFNPGTTIVELHKRNWLFWTFVVK